MRCSTALLAAALLSLTSGCASESRKERVAVGVGAMPAPIPDVLRQVDASPVSASPSGSTEPVPSAELRSANQVRTAHNYRVAHIQSLVMKGNVEAHWIGPKGETHADVGTAMICFRRPGYIALSYMAGADEPVLWAGSNPDYYWGINIPEDIAFLGRTMNVKGPFEEWSPVILHPMDLMTALGLSQIPADAEVRPSTTVLRMPNGKETPLFTFVVKGQRVDQMLTLDRRDALVRTVDVVDHTGIVLGVCRLGGYAPVGAVSASPVPEPMAATELIIDSMLMGTRVSIRAQYLGEAPPGTSHISDRLFDFPDLLKSLRVTRLVVLDHESKFPAMTAADVKQSLPAVELLKAAPEGRQR